MKKRIHLLLLATLFAVPLLFLNFDNTKDFETAKNLDIFYSLFSEISNSYVDELAPGDIMERTIAEMLKTLDPYTNFIPESDVERFTVMTKGEYGGIGATVVKRDSLLMVYDLHENAPARKAGLQRGDFLVAAEGHSLVGKTFEEYNPLLQGQAGITLQLEVLRGGERKDFTIKRENIKLSSVPFYGLLDATTGYVKLQEFTQNCGNDVAKAVVDLKSQGAQGLILDLRGNPGGLLIEAVKIVNLFVKKGERVVFTKGQNKAQNDKFYTISEPLDTEIPLVVLVDEMSASASEIVAGSLQDFDRAVILGSQTFGKGLVQTRKELAHNCLLKITTAKYYIPSGRCIQKLDYTHRDKNGNPTVVPDSLQRTFYTRNHRPVKDGGGIIPDVLLASELKSDVVNELMSNFIFFDFINKTYSYNDTARIKPETFKLTEQEYQQFVGFYKEKNPAIQSASDKFIDSLVCEAAKRGVSLDSQISAIKNSFAEKRNADFEADKEHIVKILEKEIIHSLYFGKGETQFLTRDDAYINEAKKFLADKAMYGKMLGRQN